MKKKKNNLAADVSFMIMLILLFIAIVFIVTYSEDVVRSSAILCIIFAIMIITHFTSITMGLILNIVIIFGYTSYLLYQLFVNATAISNETYFWIVLSPVLTLVSSNVFQYTRIMETENENLTKLIRDFSDIDTKTRLKNKRAYEMEMPVYHSISKRYGIGLTMIVWEFRFLDDLKRIYGRENLEKIAIKISRAMEDAFRKEDAFYLLSDQPYTWGMLLLTNKFDEDAMRERTRSKINEIDTAEIAGKNAPKLEMRIGVKLVDIQEETALTLLERAKDRLQYDV